MSAFITRIKKVGGSYYVKLEKELLQKLGLREGDFVKVIIKKVKIIEEE